MRTIAAPNKSWTEEQLLAVRGPFQLVPGEFIEMSPVGGEHGLTGTKLSWVIKS